MDKKLTYAKVSAFTQTFDYQCSDGFILDILKGSIDIKKMKSFIINNFNENYKEFDHTKPSTWDSPRPFKKGKSCTEIYKK